MHPWKESHIALELSHWIGKGQRKNFGPNEVTLDLEDAKQEAYPILFGFENTDDNVILRGKGMQYP